MADLFALASSGAEATPDEKMPGRGRRRTHNPFDEIVQKLAATGQTWTYKQISTVIESGEQLSQAKQLENALRAAGTRLDVRSKETGGEGYKTTVRTDSDSDNTVKIWVTVASRSAEVTDGETVAPVRTRKAR